MALGTCSFCNIFGKAKRGLNVIILTGGLSDDFIYESKSLIETHERKSNLDAEYKYTNYATVSANVQAVFQLKPDNELTAHSPNNLSSPCCRGYEIVEVNSRTFCSEKNRMEQWFHTEPRSDNNSDSPPSWFLFIAPSFSDSEFWKIFINMVRSNPGLSNYTVICFLVAEERLFKNAMNDKRTLVDYNDSILTEYKNFIENFFKDLDAFEDLQKNTILVPDDRNPKSDELNFFLKSQYQDFYKNPEQNKNIRNAFLKSFKPKNKCANDVDTVKSSMTKDYQNYWERIIEQMCCKVENDCETQHQAIQLILYGSHSCTRQERGIIHSLIIRKFKIPESDNSFSLTTQLAIVAIKLINDNDPESVPLIYGIAEAIYKASSQPLCRRHFFDDEYMYKLNLSLIDQTNHVLAMAGLKLCGIVLSMKVNPDRYAVAYSKYDRLTGKKIIDAVIRLLSPYIDFERDATGRIRNDSAK